MRRKIFARHSSPWSAWTRLLSAPLVLVPVWTRRWSHAAGVAAWMLANPVIFPPPADDRSFATKAILGEEMWIERRPKDTAMAVNMAASAAGVAAAIAARKRRALPATAATATQIALLLVYWRMMNEYYEKHRDSAD
ncbi:MAG: hypothetical protein GEU98_06430 [Pseudonocardiaceae bacterium]|nr:hypothetical protein [Pseudonocardiaceae bacterium]